MLPGKSRVLLLYKMIVHFAGHMWKRRNSKEKSIFRQNYRFVFAHTTTFWQRVQIMAHALRTHLVSFHSYHFYFKNYPHTPQQINIWEGSWQFFEYIQIQVRSIGSSHERNWIEWNVRITKSDYFSFLISFTKRTRKTQVVSRWPTADKYNHSSAVCLFYVRCYDSSWMLSHC